MKGMYSNEAEISVIGACLLAEPATAEAMQTVTVEDFYRPVHRRIFGVIVQQFDIGFGMDLMTVSNALATGEDGDEAMEKAADYLIQCMEYCPNPNNVGHYARIVRSWSQARAAYDAALKVVEAAPQGDPEAVIDAARGVSEACDSIEGDGWEPWHEIDVFHAETGTTTGFPLIDRLTGVGYVDGQTTFWGARTKGGKSTMMVTSMRLLAEQGVKVAYATFADLSPAQLKRRTVKNAIGIGGKCRDPYLTERFEEEVFSQHSRFRDNLLVYSAKKGGRDIESFVASAKAKHRKFPFRVLFCDYIQRIGVRGKATMIEQMETVSKRLKELAEDLNCAVVVGTQLTRQEDGQFRSKYAAAIEEDAGLMLVINREKGSPSATIECKLNRFGPDGIEFDFVFDDRRLAFEEKPATHVPSELCREELS
jgi:replicative DNA helicase